MDWQSVKNTVLVGSLSSWFRVWAAMSKAQTPALQFIDCCSMATDFLMDMLSGSLIKTISAIFFLSSAHPSVLALAQVVDG